jgi:membrane protein
MYAGLASVMIALVFLYISASIFIFGGELNSAIDKLRNEKLGRRPQPVRTRKTAAKTPR